jgi:regulator of sirC expression with transglutaminase-like and TPR domain
MQQEISRRFNSLARRAESLRGLAEGALILASEAKPDVDIEAGLETVSSLVERIRPLVESARGETAAVEALNHGIFELEGFRGNQEQYDDPRNSFLDDVLTRRQGLPITLSVLYVEVARRLGFEAYGIGFPGHFLAKVTGLPDAPGGEIIVDPFFGRTLRLEDCAERLRAAAGDDVSLDPHWLRPATAQEIYVRMLNNLKLHYLRRGEGLSALGCFDRIVVLAPEAAHEYRDRGLLLERLDCVLPAIQDLTRFLELSPHDESAATIRARRNALSQRKPMLH